MMPVDWMFAGAMLLWIGNAVVAASAVLTTMVRR